MVKICSNDYPSENETVYKEYFEKYPFLLSSFQKYAIESIVEGNHILVTAHTGSGKTLPAEFAIEHFVSLGKKVIYTSPIKALSNQKFYEFTQKFPDISFGILTGDIKTNPEADVLIMTTEILMNTLYSKFQDPCTNICTEIGSNKLTNLSMFEMDFENELACVIFDEVHYINDPDRGKVWEETIMMLPHHVQMVMLSATLDSPEKFALWCENRGSNDLVKNKTNKIVYLTTTYERVVPLTHYSFITCTQGLFKILKDKALEKEIMKTTNTLNVIQDSRSNFNEPNYLKISRTLKLFHDKNHYVKRQHVLNSVSKYMVENNMLPAICFVLSRKSIEQCAKEITTNLLEDDSKVPYTVARECEQIIRKLPNYQEYLNLPEYVNMVSLLEKGIAIHHAGVMPVLREMVELLFSRGYIKLLFATETFAVGINMPTKTVLFTDINKFDGSTMRPLYSHEYTQMAGRAGRRGIDTVGHVVHLTNLFKDVDQTTMKQMMKGKPQTLTSKFKISYNLILNLISVGEKDYTKYVKRSMIQNSIDETILGYKLSLDKLEKELSDVSLLLRNCRTPIDLVEDYSRLKENKLTSVNKKRKEIERSMQKILSEHPTVESEVEIVSKYAKKKNEINNVNNLLVSTEGTMRQRVENVIRLLEKNGCIEKETNEANDTHEYKLTIKGTVATHIRETHCIIFSDLICKNAFLELNPEEIVGLLSCFTNVSVQEEKRTLFPSSSNMSVKNLVEEIVGMYTRQYDLELTNDIDTGIDYTTHYDLIDYMMRWCRCENYSDCKQLLQEMQDDKDIFLGEFVKAILKINNIAFEMEKIYELIGNVEMLSKVRQVPELTLKYVATNQSLYV